MKRILRVGFSLAALVAIVLSNVRMADAQANTMFGTGALSNNTTGTNDTALGFNALNANTALRLERRVNSPQLKEAQEIISPRIFRLGLRVNF